MARNLMAHPELRHPFEASRIHAEGQATVLYQGRTRAVESPGTGPQLLVRPDALENINGFELKPEGACLGGLCYPLPEGVLVEQEGEQWVHFGMHPKQGSAKRVVECRVPVKDQRVVTDSGGHKETRYVIETTLTLGHISWHAELTLTDRDSMKFRMLLGRTALDGRFLVDPAASYRFGGKPAKHKQKKIL